jgi:hypothetical protein
VALLKEFQPYRGRETVRAFVLGLFLALVGINSASAAVRIDGDPGGQVGKYLAMFMWLRDSGERVIIDGPCMSACTLVLSVIPRDRICITDRALLGFHAAWTPDEYGRPLTHGKATQLLYSTYPKKVRDWIRRNGGLSRQTILMRSGQLSKMYRTCH